MFLRKSICMSNINSFLCRFNLLQENKIFKSQTRVNFLANDISVISSLKVCFDNNLMDKTSKINKTQQKRQELSSKKISRTQKILRRNCFKRALESQFTELKPNVIKENEKLKQHKKNKGKKRRHKLAVMENTFMNTSVVHLQRSYSDGIINNSTCLNPNVIGHPNTIYQPYCLQPLTSLVPERFMQRKYYKGSKPNTRALSVGNITESTTNFLSNVGYEQERLKNFRKWTPTNLGTIYENMSQISSNDFIFTLMSYNVLAQILISEHPYLYRAHDPRALYWKFRKTALMLEFKKYNPDILCLQEVQSTHIDSFYNQLLDLGYKGIFKRRTGHRIDGCAIYYKEDKFDLVEYTTVEYFQPGIEILNRENIAIIARFCEKYNKEKQFVVATTHLLYNPKRQDVRLAQTQLLLAEIDRLAFKEINHNYQHTYVPIIVTGDFNLEPYTPVYDLIVKGKVKYSNLTVRRLERPKPHLNEKLTGQVLIPKTLRITDNCQFADIAFRRRRGNKRISREEELQLVTLSHSERQHNSTNFLGNLTEARHLFSTGELRHRLNLQSVYTHFNNENMEMEATTHQNKWITVDYIFYSAKYGEINEEKVEGNLKLLSKLSLPTDQHCQQLPTIPNLVFGSDHLAIAAKFLLKT